MKKLMSAVVIFSFSTTLFGANFNETKQKEIDSLEQKQEMIQKRLECIKEAKNSKELRICKKKFSLIKRKSKND